MVPGSSETEQGDWITPTAVGPHAKSAEDVHELKSISAGSGSLPLRAEQLDFTAGSAGVGGSGGMFRVEAVEVSFSCANSGSGQIKQPFALTIAGRFRTASDGYSYHNHQRRPVKVRGPRKGARRRTSVPSSSHSCNKDRGMLLFSEIPSGQVAACN